jgi:hypothetical protein
MRKIKIFHFAAVLCFMMCALLFGDTNFESKIYCITGECSDDIKDCKPKRAFNSENNDCACFDCEIGTRKQRLICTNKPDDKKALFEYIKNDTQIPPVSNP